MRWRTSIRSAAGARTIRRARLTRRARSWTARRPTASSSCGRSCCGIPRRSARRSSRGCSGTPRAGFGTGAAGNSGHARAGPPHPARRGGTALVGPDRGGGNVEGGLQPALTALNPMNRMSLPFDTISTRTATPAAVNVAPGRRVAARLAVAPTSSARSSTTMPRLHGRSGRGLRANGPRWPSDERADVVPRAALERANVHV